MRKKVLFITSRPIYPITDGGQIRTAQQLNFLSKCYDVDIICQTERFVTKLSGQQFLLKHKVEYFRTPRWKSYLRTLRFLFNHKPLQVNYYYDQRIARYIKKHFSSYDIVFCNNIRTAEYVRELNGVKKVLDFVDAISMNYEKAKDKASGLKKLIYSIDYRRCKRYEQLVLESFDSCAIISEIDKSYIENVQKNLCGRE